MKMLKFFFLFSLSLLVTPNVLATVEESKCYGTSTLLYSNNDMELSICHGEYTKIDRSQLGQWQSCVDAMIQIKDKKQGKMSLYADCHPTRTKYFMIQGNSLMLRHFYVEYPGFVEKPLMIETFDLTTNTKKYSFTKKFSVCSKKDIDNAFQQINSTLSKPFDGATYFASVYGSFYKLRDCATTEPIPVLAALRKYKKSGVFDGEVAETLSEVIAEVELISAATIQHR